MNPKSTHPARGTRRVIHDAGWTITQVAEGDGIWWNIRIERTAK